MGRIKVFSLTIFVVVLQSGMYTAAPSSDISIDARILDGTVADVESARHVVQIRYRSESNEFGGDIVCGGSLISDNVVLTAAHCFLDLKVRQISFEDASSFSVSMGNLDLNDHGEDTLVFNHLEVVRGNFNRYFEQDIALIFLNSTVPADLKTVKPITLNDGILEPGTVCQAVGWGSTGSDEATDILRVVDQAIIEPKLCSKDNSYGSHMRGGMICAGDMEGGRGICDGDSGGPLVCNGIQAGVISWSRGCGLPLKPGVFTDVSFYKTWILQQVAAHKASAPKFAPIPYTRR